MHTAISYCGIHDGKPMVKVNQEEERPLWNEGMGELPALETCFDTVLDGFDEDGRARVHFVVKDFVDREAEWWFGYDQARQDFFFEFEKPVG